MNDRWTDERAQERWRRERAYGREDPNWNDAGRRRAERRNFDDHEHDADWDRDYDEASRRQVNYELRDPGYGYAAATGTRWTGYSGAPPYGGERAGGYSPYEGRDARPADRNRAYGGPAAYGRRGYGAVADQELERERQAALGRWDERHRRDERPDHREEPRGFFDRAADTVASWFSSDDNHGQTWRGHRGKGPKGYRRSDQRISDDVHDTLTDDPFLDASQIEVKVDNGEVTLSGVVSDREAKHRAERGVERISGVDHVQNNLRIGHLEGSKPFETGNPLTSPGRGFGDSAVEAQARGKTPDQI